MHTRPPARPSMPMVMMTMAAEATSIRQSQNRMLYDRTNEMKA